MLLYDLWCTILRVRILSKRGLGKKVMSISSQASHIPCLSAKLSVLQLTIIIYSVDTKDCVLCSRHWSAQRASNRKRGRKKVPAFMELLFQEISRFIKIHVQDEPSPVVQWLRFHLPVQGIQVQSQVGQLRSHMPHGQNPKA